jgi:hypothetical protein
LVSSFLATLLFGAVIIKGYVYCYILALINFYILFIATIFCGAALIQLTNLVSFISNT